MCINKAVMKNTARCVILAIAAIMLVACSTDYNTAMTDQLTTQYDFYTKSKKAIISSTNVSPEQADEIFLVLVSCGLDGKIVSINKKNDTDNTYNYYWQGASKTNEFDLENNVVQQVRHGSNIVYPYELSAEYLTQKKLDHVTELIDALSEVSHRTEYNEAQAAYDDLSKNQQKALGKSYLEKLESINNIVTQNEQLLDKTTRQIDKLKSGSSRTTYEKAQAAFDELPEHLKGQIDKEYIQKLNDTAEAIRERENSADSSITTNVSDNYKTPEQLEKAGYVLNTSSHKIHKTSCSDVKRIKAQNYSTTPDYNYAVSKRYSPCGRCKP